MGDKKTEASDLSDYSFDLVYNSLKKGISSISINQEYSTGISIDIDDWETFKKVVEAADEELIIFNAKNK